MMKEEIGIDLNVEVEVSEDSPIRQEILNKINLFPFIIKCEHSENYHSRFKVMKLINDEENKKIEFIIRATINVDQRERIVSLSILFKLIPKVVDNKWDGSFIIDRNVFQKHNYLCTMHANKFISNELLEKDVLNFNRCVYDSNGEFIGFISGVSGNIATIVVDSESLSMFQENQMELNVFYNIENKIESIKLDMNGRRE